MDSNLINVLYLSSFVFIPLVMLLGLWLARNVNQVRGVMVAGSSLLLLLAVYLVFDFLGARQADPTSEMLFTGRFQLVRAPSYQIFRRCRRHQRSHVVALRHHCFHRHLRVVAA